MVDHALEVLKALSDKNRLRIFLAIVNKGELCACQIIELLGVTGATASRHMSILVGAGLLDSRKEGRWVYYSLNHKGVDQSGIIDWIKSQVEDDDKILSDCSALENILDKEPEEICRKQRGIACCP